MNYLQRTRRLSETQAEQVERLLAAGQLVSLHSWVEILDVGAERRALLWIADGDGHSRLGSCQLSAGQWAEAMLCLERGLTPVYHMVWHVLGRTPDGAYSLATACEPQLEAQPRRYAEGESAELLGLAS